jgi:hypothetical protein
VPQKRAPRPHPSDPDEHHSGPTPDAELEPWDNSRRRARGISALFDQTYQVPFGVADKGLPFVEPCRAQRIVLMAEDDVGLGLDDNSLLPESLHRCREILDFEVDEGAGGIRLQQQPCLSDLEEEQTGWFEAAGGFGPEQFPVELFGAIEVDGPLGNLYQACWSHRPRTLP